MLKKYTYIALVSIFFSCSGNENEKSTSNTDEVVEQHFGTDDEMENITIDNNQKVDNNTPNNLNAFIPEGFVLLDSAKGDLNKDKYDDIVLIVKNPNEVKVGNSSRPVILLQGNSNGTYQEVGRNDYITLCYDCGGVFGDPYDGIAINNGFFSIEHFGGSSSKWTKIITFKYDKDKNDWLLHKDGGVSYMSANPEEVQEDIKTTEDFGVIKFEDYKNDWLE